MCSPDNPDLEYTEGRLVSGKIEALLHLVVENSMDDSFFFAFILCARLFIKPHDLLGDIITLSENLAGKPSSSKNFSKVLSSFFLDCDIRSNMSISSDL
ncbi:ras-GEF domain-containing family member 1A-like [Lycorma delicatula]|uniref:ras-GEF domain-containing family member 1A-like n=1 Tax=Lycorma delicatula TaxID=130591 RepID=UPI003F515C28